MLLSYLLFFFREEMIFSKIEIFAVTPCHRMFREFE